jgi:hypothetical protein
MRRPISNRNQNSIGEGGGRTLIIYFKRAPQVRLGGRVEEGNDDDLMLAEKSDLLIRALKLTKVSGAKGEMD